MIEVLGRRATKAARRATLVDRAVGLMTVNGMSAKQASRELGISHHIIWRMTWRSGTDILALRLALFERENAAAFEAVRCGASIGSQAENDAHYGRLYRYCRQRGIGRYGNGFNQSKHAAQSSSRPHTAALSRDGAAFSSTA